MTEMQADTIRAWRNLQERCNVEVDQARDGQENWSLMRELVSAEKRVVRYLRRIGRRQPSGWTTAVVGGELFAVPPDAEADRGTPRIVELGAWDLQPAQALRVA